MQQQWQRRHNETFFVAVHIPGFRNPGHRPGTGMQLSIDSVIQLDSANFQPVVDILKAIQLETHYSTRNIPKFIKQTLQCLKSGFEIVDANRPLYILNMNFGMLRNRSTRRLLYLASNENYLVMTYRKGVCFTSHHLVIFRFKNQKVLNCWVDWSGGDFDTIEELIYVIQHPRHREHFLKFYF